MDQQEIDRLISDIQDYLNQVGKRPSVEKEGGLAEQAGVEAGFFISPSSRAKMDRVLKYSRFGSYAIEALTIALFTAGVLSPFRTWPATLMFLIGVLLFGIFAITVLLNLQARIELLIGIEGNTHQIALNKARIADALEKLQME